MNKVATDFNLKDQNGETVSLKSYLGKWVVLYFYPKDDTPGCTTEACNFRDARGDIVKLNDTVIIGISKDSVASHAKFAKKYGLNFKLLSDPDHKIIETYNSWGKKKFMGREFTGTLRNTFLISPEGLIVKEYLGVNPKQHSSEIIRDLKTLQQTN
ncbi:MAG: thioredoxin-dependent thiol peroxidase [Candidatus Saccharimonadales bacterium]